jgi:C1A family cysteine protease
VGPLSVVVNAKAWRLYQGGVLTFDACGNITMSSMDHAVQLVGYNAQAEIPYWIVRNTWSTLWGDRGYIYLEYGRNTCGLANLVTYPKVAAGSGPAMGHSRRLGMDSSFRRLYRDAIAEEVV